MWLGWLLGAIFSFCSGRFLGRAVASRIVDEKTIEGRERELGRRARFVHILLCQVAVPSEIPGYVPGILRYSFPLYLTALAITELPYAIVTVYLGESCLEGEGAVLILLGFGVNALSLFLFQGIRKMLAQRN